ncbi:unnamed protein product, partial [marine sediment metagenome]
AGNENSTSVVFTKDTAYPAVTINSPLNQTYDTNSITFNVTATDGSDVDSCWYSLTGGSVNYSMTETNPPEWDGTNSSMTQGSHTVNYYCNDSSNNLNDTEQETFFIDSIYPLIDFTTGTEDNDTAFSRNWIFVNVSVTEDNFENITYRLYNSTEEVNTTTYTTEIKEINWTSLSDETYTYNVTIVDVANNQNTTETRTIILDNVAPVMNYVNPTENSGVSRSRNYIEINITALDDNLDSIVIKLYNLTHDQINSSTTTSSRANSST